MDKFKNKYFGDKNFYREVQKITIPILLQSMLTVSAQLIDNVMVGQLGENSISAVAASNQVFFVIMVTLFGVAAGGQMYMSQFNGASNDEKTTKSFQSTVILSLLFALVAYNVLYIFSNNILSIYIGDKEVLDLSLGYYKYIILSVFPFALNNAFSTGFRSIGKTKIPMFLGFVSVIVNTFLNFILIFGLDLSFIQLPALGVAGAGIATLSARIIESIGYAIVSLRLRTPIKMKVKSIFKLDKKILEMITKKSMPLIANEFLWALGHSSLVAIYTKQSATNLASFQISQSFANMFFSLMGAVGAAVAVIVGNKLGRNELEDAKEKGYKLAGFGGMVGLVCGSILFLTNFIAPYLYAVDADIMSMARRIIILMSVMFPVYYITASYFFILRAGGDSKSVLIMDAGFSWIVYIPVALFVSHVLNFSMFYIYVTIQVMDLVKLKVGHYMVSKEHWVKNLTK